MLPVQAATSWPWRAVGAEETMAAPPSSMAATRSATMTCTTCRISLRAYDRRL